MSLESLPTSSNSVMKKYSVGYVYDETPEILHQEFPICVGVNCLTKTSQLQPVYDSTITLETKYDPYLNAEQMEALETTIKENYKVMYAGAYKGYGIGLCTFNANFVLNQESTDPCGVLRLCNDAQDDTIDEFAYIGGDSLKYEYLDSDDGVIDTVMMYYPICINGYICDTSTGYWPAGMTRLPICSLSDFLSNEYIINSGIASLITDDITCLGPFTIIRKGGEYATAILERYQTYAEISPRYYTGIEEAYPYTCKCTDSSSDNCESNLENADENCDNDNIEVDNDDETTKTNKSNRTNARYTWVQNLQSSLGDSDTTVTFDGDDNYPINVVRSEGKEWSDAELYEQSSEIGSNLKGNTSFERAIVYVYETDTDGNTDVALRLWPATIFQNMDLAIMEDYVVQILPTYYPLASTDGSTTRSSDDVNTYIRYEDILLKNPKGIYRTCPCENSLLKPSATDYKMYNCYGVETECYAIACQEVSSMYLTECGTSGDMYLVLTDAITRSNTDEVSTEELKMMHLQDIYYTEAGELYEGFRGSKRLNPVLVVIVIFICLICFIGIFVGFMLIAKGATVKKINCPAVNFL